MQKPTCEQIQKQYRKVKKLGENYIKAIHGVTSLEDLDEQYEKEFEKETALLWSMLEEYGISPERAREIIGEDNFIGPEDIHNTFSFTPEDIPRIPFSKKELTRAKELGHHLILYADDGAPLTAEAILDKVDNKTSDGKKILRDMSGLTYSTDTIRPGWRLTSPEVTENTTDKGFLGQTEALITYLRNTVFANTELPEVYQEAITTFETEKEAIQELMESNWDAATKRLSELAINQLTHETVPEVLYRLITTEKKYKTKHLANTSTNTISFVPYAPPMGVGCFASGTLSIERRRGETWSAGIGVCLSRSV